MNGIYDEQDALRPAPVTHPASARSPLAPTGNTQNQQLAPSQSSSHKHHTSSRHHHPPEPTFDIRQHPAAIAYAAAHPNRTIPKFGPYILLQTLGEGEFGKVKLGLHSHWAEEVAVKLIRRGSVENDVRMQKIRREIAVLESLHHPNIVRLYETIETDKYIGIILDYASGGELFDHILAHRYLKEKDARKLFAQLISAVWYIHKKKIVHRDLKLENLLLDRNRNIIVTDFGFANRFEHRADDLMQTSCGSPCYAAPELVISEGMYVGSAVDIWSCGVILYAMLAGYLPFDDDPENPEGDNIQQLYRYILNTPLTFPDHVSLEARDLLSKMLVPDPVHRANLQVVMDHPWLEPYSQLFTYSIEESEKMSKEMQEAKKYQYRKAMREREKAARVQVQRQERHQTHHVHGESSASRDKREQLYDASMGQGGEFDPKARRGGRAVASAIVMPSSAQEEDRFGMAAEEAGHDPFAAVPNGIPVDVGMNGVPSPSRDGSGDSRQRKASTKSHNSNKKAKRGDSAGNGASPTAPAGAPNGQKASSKKAGAFRHTIQLEYDDSPEIQPAPPTPPRPSSKSQRASAQYIDLDNPEFGPLNGNVSQQEEPVFAHSVVDPVKQSPTRSRKTSNTPRPQVPIPAVPAIPDSLSPTRSRGPGISPVLARNPATDPGPFDHAAHDTSATPSSAGLTPLSSPPLDREAVHMPSSSPVTPVTADSHNQDKSSSQEKPSRPPSSGGRKHTRGISIDRIVGIGKMLTGTGKDTEQPQGNGGPSVSKRASLGIPKRPSSKAGKKREEQEVPALPKDAAEHTNESKSTIATPTTGTTGESSTTLGPIPLPTGGHGAQDANTSESTSSSVKNSSASASGNKKRANRALSLMVDPISKMKEQRARNRASVTVGADTGAKEPRKPRQSTPTVPDNHPSKRSSPFSSIPDDLALSAGATEKTPQQDTSNSGWRLPLFRDISMRGQHRAPSQRPPIPAMPTEPSQAVDPYTIGSSLTGMAPTGATTKSQGVMDWFRRKSLAKARTRAGSSAEPPIVPPQPLRHNTSVVETINMDDPAENEIPGERATTPTQGQPSTEGRDEAKTPTRSSFRKGKNTPSVIVTAAAGEPTSSANSQRESVNSSSTTPSRMDRMVGAIKNVTHTPPAVHVPGAFNKRSMGASSGGSFGGSSSGGGSYNKQVLRLHDGPVDPSTLSSAPPQEIIMQVLEVLKSLGIEYTKDSEFRYRCVRPKRRKATAASREASGSGTPNSSTPGANGQVDKRGLPMPSSNSFAAAPGNMFKYIMRRSSSQAPPAPAFGNTPPLAFDEDAIDLGTPGTPEMPAGTSSQGGAGDYVGAPAIEPIYGDKPDQHDEVRFSVEVTKIDRLDDLLSLDIRRLKGNLKSYKFLYDIIRERCNLQR